MPRDVYDMTLEEMNLYIIGAQLREQKQREHEIAQAFMTAQFAMGKNIKPLDHYLQQSRRTNGYVVVDTTPVDIESSRKMAAAIEKLDVKL